MTKGLGARFSGSDILEFGEALVAATPRIRRAARCVTRDSNLARRLTEGVLQEAWFARRELSQCDDVTDWLVQAFERRAKDVANDPRA